MKRTFRIGFYTVMFALVTGAISWLVTACTTKSSSSATTNTYASTSTKGDFAQWTMASGTLTGTWQITDNTGAVAKTLSVSANCGTADATYGYQTCTISSASCTNGTQMCSGTDAPTAGSTFYAFEVPGTALFVQGTGGGSSQLHVGFALDTSCNGVAGDYSYFHLGNDQKDLFGVYQTNADMSVITHADFQMTSATCSAANTGNGANSGNCAANDTLVAYSTGNGTGTGSETITSNTCTGGIRSFSMTGVGTIRTMQSQSGVFVVDLPSGAGGLVAFKTTNAATINDFANINFGGIVFPDNGGPKLMNGSTGAVTGSGSSAKVSISSLTFNDNSSPGITNPVITANTNATSTATNPAFPDFTVGPSGTYSNNALHTTYATPSTIPGFFRVDGTPSDAGRVIMLVMKVNNKVLGFGTVYNWRNPVLDSTNFGFLTQGVGYYNTGAFIMFQK